MFLLKGFCKQQIRHEYLLGKYLNTEHKYSDSQQVGRLVFSKQLMFCLSSDSCYFSRVVISVPSLFFLQLQLNSGYRSCWTRSDLTRALSEVFGILSAELLIAWRVFTCFGFRTLCKLWAAVLQH